MAFEGNKRERRDERNHNKSPETHDNHRDKNNGDTNGHGSKGGKRAFVLSEKEIEQKIYIFHTRHNKIGDEK